MDPEFGQRDLDRANGKATHASPARLREFALAPPSTGKLVRGRRRELGAAQLPSPNAARMRSNRSHESPIRARSKTRRRAPRTPPRTLNLPSEDSSDGYIGHGNYSSVSVTPDCSPDRGVQYYRSPHRLGPRTDSRSNSVQSDVRRGLQFSESPNTDTGSGYALAQPMTPLDLLKSVPEEGGMAAALGGQASAAVGVDPLDPFFAGPSRDDKGMLPKPKQQAAHAPRTASFVDLHITPSHQPQQPQQQPYINDPFFSGQLSPFSATSSSHLALAPDAPLVGLGKPASSGSPQHTQHTAEDAFAGFDFSGEPQRKVAAVPMQALPMQARLQTLSPPPATGGNEEASVSVSGSEMDLSEFLGHPNSGQGHQATTGQQHRHLAPHNAHVLRQRHHRSAQPHAWEQKQQQSQQQQLQQQPPAHLFDTANRSSSSGSDSEDSEDSDDDDDDEDSSSLSYIDSNASSSEEEDFTKGTQTHTTATWSQQYSQPQNDAARGVIRIDLWSHQRYQQKTSNGFRKNVMRWSFVYRDCLHEVELRHSTLSGKKVVVVDGEVCVNEKKVHDKEARYDLALRPSGFATLLVQEEGDFQKRRCYQLQVHGLPFDLAKRKWLLEQRVSRANAEDKEAQGTTGSLSAVASDPLAQRLANISLQVRGM